MHRNEEDEEIGDKIVDLDKIGWIMAAEKNELEKKHVKWKKNVVLSTEYYIF